MSQNPEGPYPLGETTVMLTVTDSSGLTSTCTAVVTVKDTSAPFVVCEPRADLNDGSPDGSYLLGGGDNCDTAGALAIFIKDSASDFVAGPFKVGESVKIIRAPGSTPGSKPKKGTVVAHVKLKGDALVYAVDSAGNESAPVTVSRPLHD